tara:strand:- start:134 stop:244 length:111 start_codon:yes stop_codon:yes gene_type:complete
MRVVEVQVALLLLLDRLVEMVVEELEVVLLDLIILE